MKPIALLDASHLIFTGTRVVDPELKYRAISPILGMNRPPLFLPRLPDQLSFIPCLQTERLMDSLQKGEITFLFDDSLGESAGLLRTKIGWNVTRFNRRFLRGLVTISANAAHLPILSSREKQIWCELLSGSYLHSVEDEHTRHLFQRRGIPAVCTGWYGFWGMTHDDCRAIPAQKADEVVTTVSPVLFPRYSLLLRLLKEEYQRVFLLTAPWDEQILQEKLAGDSHITVCSRNHFFQEQISKELSVEYVGANLSDAASFLRMKKRSLFLSAFCSADSAVVQSRGIPCFSGTSPDELQRKLHCGEPIRLSFSPEEVSRFLHQFLDNAVTLAE